MSDPRLGFHVARLLAAAAWADGQVHPEERAFLRAQFHDFPGITGADWVVLNALLETPVEQATRDAIVQDLLVAVRSAREKTYVLEMLRGMTKADGKVSQGEVEIIRAVESALAGRTTGVFRRVVKLVDGILGRDPKVAD